MSTRNAKIVVIVSLLGAAAIVACGSGSGQVIELGQPYENHPGDFAKPGVSNQDPPPTNSLASAAADAGANSGNGNGKDGGSSGGTSGTTTSGGTSGTTTSGGTSGTTTSGGTSGTTAGCPPCDGNFSCDITVTGGMTQKMTVPLATKNGACVLTSTSTEVTFACGGALTSQGSNVGTWANCAKATTTTPPDGG